MFFPRLSTLRQRHSPSRSPLSRRLWIRVIYRQTRRSLLPRRWQSPRRRQPPTTHQHWVELCSRKCSPGNIKKNESHYFKRRATALTSQCPKRVSIKMHDIFAILDWLLKTIRNLISAATQHLDSRVDRPFLRRVYGRVVSSLHIIYLTMHLSFFVDFLFQRAFAVIIFNFLSLTFWFFQY